MFKLLNTAATIADQIATVNAISLGADQDYNLSLARAVASAYAFGWYNYQHDSMALTIAFTQRQVPIAEPTGNQWLPIARVCFGDWDKKANKVTYNGVSGLTKWNIDSGKQRYASAMRLLHESNIHPDAAEEFILNFNKDGKGKKGLTGMVDKDRETHGQKRAPRKAVTKARKTELVSKAKSLPVLPENLTAALPVTGATGHFAQAWVYIEDGKVFLGGIVPDSENEALKAADVAIASKDETSGYISESTFEATPEMIEANTRMQRNFATATAKSGGNV